MIYIYVFRKLYADIYAHTYPSLSVFTQVAFRRQCSFVHINGKGNQLFFPPPLASSSGASETI